MIDHSKGHLAVCGGKPSFTAKIHVGRPNVGDIDLAMSRFKDIFDRLWFTNGGDYVIEFEKRLCEYLGVRNCVVMCNATIALEIVARSLGMTGEVIVPSFTFVATAHCLQWQQITPVFCDIDPVTHNIDPSRIESLITPRTTGILGVHVWGRGCDVNEIDRIARKHQLHVMYDAAHAFGCTHGGASIGGFGDAEVFSFHATKFFNTFEGGAVATNNDALANKIRLMRNFGFTGVDRVDHVGVNGKMIEVCAAMGLTNLDHVDHFIEVNRQNWSLYENGLKGVPGVHLCSYDPSERMNHQYVVLEIAENCALSRDEIVKVLHLENVMARRYFYPGCHEMEPYRSYFPHARLLLPHTERLTKRVMTLPTGTAVSTADIARICDVVRTACDRSQEVKAALSALIG